MTTRTTELVIRALRAEVALEEAQATIAQLQAELARARRTAPDDLIVRLYVIERQTVRQIGRALNLGHSTVHSRLRTLGVPMRPSGRQAARHHATINRVD